MSAGISFSGRGVDLFLPDDFGGTTPNYRVREKVRGRQGVYLFKKRGVVRYVGSSISSDGSEPLRMWKTILRHFQKCGPVAPGRYHFGKDNWCTSSRNDWKIVLHLVSDDASDAFVRGLEDGYIAKFAPSEQAQKKPREQKKRKRR